MAVQRWFLTSEERGNPDTHIDERHPDGEAWSTGNEVRALVHGASYFEDLLAGLRQTRPGDLVLFTDWRGDPDERLDGRSSEVSRELCLTARRGVVVKGLVWRSHLDSLQFSEAENRHLGEQIEAAGGECLLDMRVRAGGSHHQKLIVLRHPDRPERDVAYVGGIDLCHGRRDDAEHRGDPQAAPMSDAYGRNPPWHDIQLAIRGPAVGDVEAAFRERWCDPAPLSRNPLHRLADLLRRDDDRPDPLPDQLPDPPRRGTHAVQLLRTYPYRRRGYPFASQGERSVARGYAKVLRQARELIYIEDQYLWSREVAQPFAEALAARPGLRLIAVLPLMPDQGGRLNAAANAVGREAALSALYGAGGDRVAVYGLENHAGTLVYVHAKVCLVDDAWTAVGSDNLNLRSWTHDSELSCAVVDQFADGPGLAVDLRLALAREHLDRPAGDDAARDPDRDKDLLAAADLFAAYAVAADALDDWHAAGRVGPRPLGRLRHYHRPEVPARLRWPARSLYRTVFDPDGRPAALRRRHAF